LRTSGFADNVVCALSSATASAKRAHIQKRLTRRQHGFDTVARYTQTDPPWGGMQRQTATESDAAQSHAMVDGCARFKIM